ncbi:MAG: tol-pal system protein YbgF [Bauldia sp.]
MERLEAQMRTLTGQIEQLNFQLAQMRDELRLLQSGAAGQTNQRATEVATPANRRLAEGADPAGQSPARNGQTEGPINLAALAGGSPGQPASPAARSGNPRAEYDVAYRHILAGEYVEAEKGLRAFLTAYPEDRLAPDAEYWLAESLFGRALYRDAAEELVNAYKAYPKSPKAPDTLLKLGLSLYNLGERDAACQTYAKLVKDYPALNNVVLQRVRQEQKNAACL